DGRKTERSGSEDRGWRGQKTEKPSARFFVPHSGAKRRKPTVFCLLKVLSSEPSWPASPLPPRPFPRPGPRP
ncbi:MAG: hypothetical protein LBD06_04350, partial [Candidatus Accumulibacter sp.]|nr:hypothetical protein [Accumulibacter sp.]